MVTFLKIPLILDILQQLHEWTHGRFWKNLVIVQSRVEHGKSIVDAQFARQKRNESWKHDTLRDIKKLIMKNADQRNWEISEFDEEGNMVGEPRRMNVKDLDSLKGNLF